MEQALEVARVIEAVRLFEERRLIPAHLKDTHPFSQYALWDYVALGDLEDECETCRNFAGQQFMGSQIRSTFPDYTWDGDDIRPNVHLTMWGKDTCKCLLIRVMEPGDPTDNVVYTGGPVQPYSRDEDE
jgi:hypothetical protein